MTTRTIFGAALWALVWLPGLGCGGPSASGPVQRTQRVEPAETAPPQPVSASGSSEASATVGPAGGTLSLTNGSRLQIPADALSEPVEVTLAVGADGQAFGDAETQRPLGPMISVSPALVAAEGAALEVSIPRQPLPNGFEEADLAFAMEEVDDVQRAIDTLGVQTRWQFYPVLVQDDRLVARVAGVPGHRLQFGVAR